MGKGKIEEGKMIKFRGEVRINYAACESMYLLAVGYKFVLRFPVA